MGRRPKVFKPAVLSVPVTIGKSKESGVSDLIEKIYSEDTAELFPDLFKDEFPLMTMVDIPTFADTYETITLKIPQGVYEEYAKAASRSEMPIEDLMQNRLVNCKTHNALRGLWFSDSERGQLENIVQKWPIESASQVLKILVRSGTVKIDEIEVVLNPAQKRVLSLAMYGGRTPQTFFEAMVKKELRT